MNTNSSVQEADCFGLKTYILEHFDGHDGLGDLALVDAAEAAAPEQVLLVEVPRRFLEVLERHGQGRQ